MVSLLKLIAKLFGKNAMAKTIGTRTNVIKLPNNEIKRYIKKDLNIEAASDEAVMNAKKEMQELLPDLPKMNDMERLVFEGNLRRLDNRINPPMAEVVEFGTKEKVTPEGITSLIKEKGQKAPPGTVMGNLESRVKQLEASGKSLEELTKGKGKTLDDILGDVMQSQKAMSKLQDEGLVRAAVRYKMMDDLQKGVLKVPKNLEEVIRGASNEEDVINVFRKNYGEDALEQVDSLVPDFYKMTSPKEAVKKIETDFPNIQPKKIEFPETVDIDKLPPEEFATGGRVGYMGGGSTGLDYLTGMDRNNYQYGGDVYEKYLSYLNELESMGAPTSSNILYSQPNYMYQQSDGDGTEDTPTPTGVPSTFQPTKMDMFSLAVNPAYGVANIASRTKTGLSLMDRAMDAMGIGRGIGGRTQGYGVDAVNSQSVAADASAGGDAGAAAASAAGANDGPGTGGSFAQGGIVNRTGFKFGTKFGRFWKIARKVWDDINPTGDRKYDAQLVADELAEEIFKTSMDDLPQNVQIDLYALAYNNAPKVDALFKNPQSLSEAAKKGMAASKEMESLGLDVSKQSDFFKYENMKLSGELGPEQQVQAYKDKIRDEFSGMIDDTLMKQVEVDDNPQRLAEVYASIKEGLEMQRKGMTPEEIIRVMKQTPRTKNSQGGLNYLMGL